MKLVLKFVNISEFMRIGVHALAAFKQPRTGVEEYAWHLLRHLGRLQEAAEHEWVLYRPQSFSGEPFDFPRGSSGQVTQGETAPHARFEIRDLPDAAFWTQRQLSKAMAEDRPDVLFIPAHVLPRERPPKSVVTIHGVEWERIPEAYSMRRREYLRWFTKEAVAQAHKIITPSEATKRDLIELYKTPEEKIVVIPHGAPGPAIGYNAVGYNALGYNAISYNAVTAPFFLFLGRLERKKNIENIVRAFEYFKSETNLPHRLLLVGPQGHGYRKIEEAVAVSKTKDDLILPGFVSEDVKWELLRNATALLLPSWYEGFGLPILEAQAVGAPVITSITSSMPEVAGQGALYVNPANYMAIAEAMHRVVTDASLRRELIRVGNKNIARFSWEQAARDTLRVLVE